MSGHQYKVKRSKWISSATPPTISGWYEVRLGGRDNRIKFLYWSTKFCVWLAKIVPGVELCVCSFTCLIEWRGLAEEPK